MRGMWKRGYGKATRAPSDERDGSDKPDLTLPRHTSTLPAAAHNHDFSINPKLRGVQELVTTPSSLMTFASPVAAFDRVAAV